MSPHRVPIEAPGGFAPVMAIGQEDGAGKIALVSNAAPLPTVSLAPAAPSPLEGSTGISTVVGPFAPAAFAPVYLTLSGDWQGLVRVMRSTDGGTTLHPLTIGGVSWAAYAGNACEPVWAESDSSAALYLELAPKSGTITYRVSQ
ncbi:hypothetical protein [Qipengyuania sp. RANM35]|uniref:hypothetical protein n=1 Tax=Qipengyuania sp. RANM35 TaxID=3068635 RepID=UPI0034DB0538